ncbi:MAG TPA: hypothetical protein VFQ61_14850 [Polyangiaceae bacterium]|nr:hypothetical protein [Polyangiaceae bacterium]
MQRLDLGQAELDLSDLGFQRPKPISADTSELRICLDAFVPALQPFGEHVALALEDATLLGGLLAHDALVLHELAQDLAASLVGEDVLGDVAEHGVVERVDGDPVTLASLFARATEFAAVVVTICRLAVGVEFPGALELASSTALATSQDSGEQ